MKTYLLAFLVAIASLCASAQSLSPVSATAIGVAVTINPPTIPIGQTASLVAQLQMSDGTLGSRVTNQCVWTTATASVASISGNTANGLTAGSSSLSCLVGAFNGAPGLTGSATLTVTASPLITNPAAGCTAPCALPAATNGAAYSFTFMATGGTLPYTWTNNVGSPPTGLTLSSGGVLSGTPSVNATTTWTVKVTDAVPNNTTLQVSLTVNGSPGCGTPPNYCARQDTAVSSGATDNGGKPPAALLGLNCATPGNCGTPDCVLDANNSGPAQGYICRISDFTMAGAGNILQVNSSSTTRQWSTDSLLYEANINGNTAWWLLTPGSPPTIRVKGNASVDKNGLSFNVGPSWSANPCTVPLCGTAASTSYLFYAAGAGAYPARNTINKYVLDTTQAAWTGSTGSGQSLSAAITGSVLLDPINCTGLSTYMNGVPEGQYWNRWVAPNTADQSADKLDHVSGAAYRYAQDEGSLIILNDSSQTPGSQCRWLDVKTGQVGGNYGPTGATTGFGPLPPPAAPTVSLATTGGSLDCTQKYALWQEYVVEGKNGTGGQGGLGSQTTVGPNGAGSTCSLSVSPPTANPGSGSGLNLIMTATGYNNYACKWVSSACVGGGPFMQANAGASLPLAQPVISSVTGCTTGSSSNTVTYWVVAGNASGTSIPSAPFSLTVTSNTTPGCTVNFGTVANATNYDVLRDDLSIRACTATSGSCRDNTQSPFPYGVQSVPIASSSVISAISLTGPVAPTVNGAGLLLHNWRMDESGSFIVIEVADAYAQNQGAAANAPRQLIWPISTVNLIPSQPLTQVPPYVSNASAHWTHGFGTMISWPQSVRAEGIITTLSNSAASMNASETFLNAANGTLDTQSGDQHIGHANSINSTPDTPIFRNAWPTSNSYVLPSVPYDGEVTAWQTPIGISSVSRASNVVTVTTSAAHNLQSGANVTLVGVLDATYNGTANGITVTGATTFTFAQTAANSSSSGGSVDRPMMRFCHTWESGAQGNSSGQPRGGISPDGKWFTTNSDMQRNSLGLQGTSSVGVGCKDGTNSGCALGGGGTTNARWDIYVCQLK